MEIWGRKQKTSLPPSKKYFLATPGLSQSFNPIVDCSSELHTLSVQLRLCSSPGRSLRKASPWLRVREDRGQSAIFLIKKLIYFTLFTYLVRAHMLWAMCGGQRAVCGSSCPPSTMWSLESGSGPQAWQETELSPILILHIFRNI